MAKKWPKRPGGADSKFFQPRLSSWLPSLDRMAQWNAFIQASRKVTTSVMSNTTVNTKNVPFLFYKIGDTSLPGERPEMLNDDLWKQRASRS
jgi:hypothetical protein